MTCSVTVSRPREEVFDYIADANNDPVWCLTVLESNLVAGTPGQPAARYQEVQKPDPSNSNSTLNCSSHHPRPDFDR